MHYHVVFDITQTDFPRFEWFLPVIVGLLGLGFIVFAWLRKGIHPFSFTRAIGPTIIVAVVWSYVFATTKSDYHHYLEVKSAMQKSKCEVVEGVVSGFQQIRRGKGGSGRICGEMFAVNETDFQYREWSGQAGFHQTGIIHDGMRVRIYYYAGNDPADTRDIARLEIAE